MDYRIVEAIIDSLWAIPVFPFFSNLLQDYQLCKYRLKRAKHRLDFPERSLDAEMLEPLTKTNAQSTTSRHFDSASNSPRCFLSLYPAEVHVYSTARLHASKHRFIFRQNA